jgi:hypothetical protein
MNICAVYAGTEIWTIYGHAPRSNVFVAKHVIEFFPSIEFPIGLNLGGSIGNLR